MVAPPLDFPSAAARALEAELAARVSGEVRFDAGSRALYSSDASNYRLVPIGVVVPRSVDDVVATVGACRSRGAPVLSRGGGTSLAGQCVNVAVVIDYSKYLNRILWLAPERRRARVEPGCVLDSLRDAAEVHHLTFGPDPATHDHNTLGGMIGNNSCGVHSIMAGRTVDNVHALDILTYDGLRLEVGATSTADIEAIVAGGGRRGDIYRRLRDLRDAYGDEIRARFPRIPRRVSGFSLDQLLPENGFNVARALVGSEGTCVAVLGAELDLVPSPPHRVLALIGYPDIFVAADQVTRIRALGVIGLEGMDDRLIAMMVKKGLHPDDVRLLPEGGGWLLAEFGADTAEDAEAAARAAMADLENTSPRPSVRLCVDKGEQHRVWAVREAGLGATANVPGHPLAWPGWEDAAVPPDAVGRYLRQFRALLDRYGYQCALYGHFGDGCVHVRIDFDFSTQAGIIQYRAFTADAADLVVAHGGSLSGEHGDGQARGDLIERMFGPRLMQAFREFKAIWDPDGRMNPGKVIDAWPRDSFLQLADWHQSARDTAFAFTADQGRFEAAALRCVGVGKCRKPDGEVMCPSYQATREEKHSTRGRATMLFEMVHGGVIDKGWRSPEVWDALDLCLSCKGCKHDCPVNVDMATYRAEFAYHYFLGRWRPRHAYAMGLIHWWAQAAEAAPGMANWLLSTRFAKWAGGIAPRRRMPAFAPATFRQGFRRKPAGGRPRVILFLDTFTDHFHPLIAHAAVAVLERAGFAVDIPSRAVCCGRPLYAWGMLDLARSQLATMLNVLDDDIQTGMPVVGLEPACLATLTDELRELFPHDGRARRLGRQAVSLPDLLLSRSGWSPPRLEGKAILHPHCYQRAVLGFESEEKLLSAMGLDWRVADPGCCGMAGSFGFEAPHYEVSMARAEQTLLPAIRDASPGTFLIADGFSCQEQIRQGTGREVFHIAQILDLAGGEGGVA